MAETHQADLAGQLALWKTRGDGKAAEAEPRRRAKVIQLPLWPETKRGAPNAVLRGALFAAIQGKGRQYMLRKELVSPRMVSLFVTPGHSLTRPTLMYGSRRCTWPGRKPSAQSVISPPTAFSRRWAGRRVSRTTNGSRRPLPAWPRPPLRSRQAGGPISAR